MDSDRDFFADVDDDLDGEDAGHLTSGKGHLRGFSRFFDPQLNGECLRLRSHLHYEPIAQ
jgi:hypothetical protein